MEALSPIRAKPKFFLPVNLTKHRHGRENDFMTVNVHRLMALLARVVIGVITFVVLELTIRVLMLGPLPNVYFIQADLIAFVLLMATFTFLPKLRKGIASWHSRKMYVALIVLGSFLLPFIAVGILEQRIQIARVVNEVPAIPGMKIVEAKYTRGDWLTLDTFVYVVYTVENNRDHFSKLRVALDDKAANTGWRKGKSTSGDITYYYLSDGILEALTKRPPCTAPNHICVRRSFAN